MAKVEGIAGIVKALKKRLDKLGTGKTSVSVGYSQGYSLHVHENLESFHKVGKAKFLSDPAHEMSAELGATVRANLEKGRTMEETLLIAGLKLQRASQKQVPVDTGALRASAFTRVEAVS